MTIRMVKATDLKPGDVLALPMGKTATITEVSIGTKFVTMKTNEYPTARAGRYDEVMVLEAPPLMEAVLNALSDEGKTVRELTAEVLPGADTEREFLRRTSEVREALYELERGGGATRDLYGRGKPAQRWTLVP